jgi:cell division septum initiation protein DivIVA
VSDSGELAALRQQAGVNALRQQAEVNALPRQAEVNALSSPHDARREAQQLLAAARAEADAVRFAAEQTATALVQRAQQQAATIQERARQELFWCRRQLRQEREVITRCQRALVDQLTMLSGVAVETAKSLYETPESSPVDEDSSGLFENELLELARSEG